jgi:hypothetical protein
VRVREYGEGDGYTWFPLEAEAAEPLITEPLGAIATFMEAANQLAAGLQVLHSHGLEHGWLCAGARLWTDAEAGAWRPAEPLSRGAVSARAVEVPCRPER